MTHRHTRGMAHGAGLLLALAVGTGARGSEAQTQGPPPELPATPTPTATREVTVGTTTVIAPTTELPPLTVPLGAVPYVPSPGFREGLPAAAPQVPPEVIPESSPAQRALPRFRAGFGGHFGFGYYAAALVGGIGVSADLGVQWGDKLATFANLRAVSIFYLNGFSAGASVEYTLNDWFSVGGGLAWIASVSLITSFGQDLAVPLFVAFNVGGRRPGESTRRVFRVTLESAITPGIGSRPGFYGGMTLGYAAM
ncbi:MAG: hypothetical protein Q8Q09_24955 [Deltaproteobacteria bacterium]|nr:hypothetical protein [Deltaproteobacteria bacterium]